MGMGDNNMKPMLCLLTPQACNQDFFPKSCMATGSIKVLSGTVLSAIPDHSTAGLDLFPLVIHNSHACEVPNTSKTSEQFTWHRK